MGDLRIQAFGLPYLASSQEATVMSVGVSLDLFMPTGSVDAGLGSGRWNVAPGMLVGLHLVGPLLMFGILAYSASIPGDPASTEDIIHSLKVTLFLVLKLPRAFYVQVIPDLLQNLNGERSTFFTTEFVFGWQWENTLAIDMRYRREFVSDVGGIDRAAVALTLFF
jgi:hypothetical protein